MYQECGSACELNSESHLACQINVRFQKNSGHKCKVCYNYSSIYYEIDMKDKLSLGMCPSCYESAGPRIVEVSISKVKD